MKHHIILLIVTILSCLTGFAQGGYDPENPGDPNPFRKLTVMASPKAGGSVNTGDSQVAVGQSVSCFANENRYYDFVHWLRNGEVVSTESYYTFTMPDEDVEMTAVFELNYDPQNPEDPQVAKPTHRVTITASPGKGGHFNSSVFKLSEGDSINIYAYPNEGYRFEEWLLEGVLVSTKNPLKVIMTDKDLNYTARFSYNPISPSDPSVNLFNPRTGEMIVDKFEQGYLYSAIYHLLNDDYVYTDIQSLLVCGMMDGSDFGVMDHLSNCSVIDLSRTNGYNEIPSYAFESATALTELLLPSCINSIGRYAFQGCNNLSVINCYAVIPPALDYGVFDGVDNSIVIKVPAQSIDLYKNATGWKDFTILPADDDVYSLTVSLPADANDGRYKNMGIELLNTSNGQRYKYLITDKTEYVFGNLLSSAKYNVAVKNGKGDVLGEISDLEVVDKDLTVAFQSLRQPLDVTLKVLTPDGTDVSSEVDVKWYNDANEILHRGVTLTGVLENTVVSYTISLPQQWQTIYSQPTSKTITVSKSNSLICTLETLNKCILEGRIIDKENQPISAAVITVSQNINGTYANSENVLSDNDGNFSLEIPNVPVKVTISANGYIGQTKELQSASVGLGETVLEKNVGITIFPSYTFQESTSKGEEISETDWYSNDANIAYRISDINGNEISNCIYQAGAIILPETIGLEDNVSITVFSKDNKFKDVSQLLYLTSKSVYVKLPIVEYGGIRFKTTDTETKLNTCILYDATERQVGKATLHNNGISFTHLPDGKYSLITMNKSSLLGSIQNLSSLRETPLEEGKDFLINKVDVISGQISDVSIANVPDLDETKLYYTNSKETYFMPNKSQLTIGNYVTLKAKITIKDEYVGDIDAATLIVDIPSNCELVENSIISGSGYLGYEYANNRLSIPIQNLSDAVRFCIVPLEGGDCKPSAFVKLIIDNEDILQPIGSAYFEAKKFSLAAPQKTSKTNIAIRGTATSDSEVLIYDNETLVGSTYSMPNGQWSVSLSLHKPYSKSIHNLYGEVITKDGKRLLTQTKVVDYDQSYVDLSKVTMVYNNNSIIFDHLNGKNTANSYSYVPGTTDFTFIADFTDNNPEKISNVVIKVLASDGSVQSIPAEYNSASLSWVARTNYTNSNKLPVNVTAEFDVKTELTYSDERYTDQSNAINSFLDSFEASLESSKIEILNESNNYWEGLFSLNDNFTGSIAIRELSLDNPKLNNETAFSCEIDNVSYQYIYSQNNNAIYLVIWSTNNAYEITLKEAYSSDGIKRAPIAVWVDNIIDYIYENVFSGDIVRLYQDLNFWNQQYGVSFSNHYKYNLLIEKLLSAKCSDGESKLSNSALEFYEIYRQSYKTDCRYFEDEFERNLQLYKVQIDALRGIRVSLSALSVLGGIVTKGSSIVLSWANIFTKQFAIELGQNVIENIIQNGIESLNGAKNMSEYLWNWCFEEENKIIDGYTSLSQNIQDSYRKCPKDEEGEEDEDGKDDFPTPPITPSIDPSGYVYEAVPSNRIQGVTATAYYKQQQEDIYGDITETAVVWDATPFGQENPLITDAQGKYAWDVPAGMWQVRFEKEGYEPAQSAWMPVPPPQLDVNIAMTQAKQPEVKTVHAYSNGVTIEFDKFMLPSTLTIGNVVITQNGNIVNGNIESSDMELDANGNAFCSKIEFKPESPLAEGEATLFVSKAVKSYANINMGEDFMQAFTVEPRVSEIKVDNNIEVNSGSTITITASVLPASASAGKTVLIESLNPMIASVSSERVETDVNGLVSFDVSGIILGSTSLKLSIEDYDIEAYVDVKVVMQHDENQVATPYASIKSGEIKAGTEIYLYCETENASIYYTMDGSCPCDINRKKYDETPIIANNDFTLKVMAEAEGMMESEIAEYHYTIDNSGIDNLQIDEMLSVYPIPLGEYLNISNGDFLIDSVTIYNMNGVMMLKNNIPQKRIALKVGSLTSGIYLLEVRTNGHSIVKKVIKR